MAGNYLAFTKKAKDRTDHTVIYEKEWERKRDEEGEIIKVEYIEKGEKKEGEWKKIL